MNNTCATILNLISYLIVMYISGYYIFSVLQGYHSVLSKSLTQEPTLRKIINVSLSMTVRGDDVIDVTLLANHAPNQWLSCLFYFNVLLKNIGINIVIYVCCSFFSMIDHDLTLNKTWHYGLTSDKICNKH